MSEEDRDATEKLRQQLDYKYREVVEDSGVAPEVALEQGYRLEKTKAGLRREGYTSRSQQRVPALVIPRIAPSGERIAPVIKPDSPREIEERGKKRVLKYESVSGSEIRLSVHPRTLKVLRDVAYPLWATEGEKKGAALVSHGAVTVVVQGTGCWNVPRDWEDIKLYGREVVIAFDADVMANPNVLGELEKLSEFLRGSRGAKVKYLNWPEKYRGTKTGVDDVLGAGEASLQEIHGWAQDAPDEKAAPVGIALSDLTVEYIRWLWRNRFPRGKVSVLDGDPGTGKSLILVDLAARVTSGTPMPDGEEVERAGAVLVCAEDDAADTILPRFLAAGGDPTRARVIGSEKPFVIPEDLDKLERAINQVGASFVAIDPVMSFLSDEINSNRDQDVRRALQPLVDIAKRTGAAVVICRHLNKSSSGGQPIYRGQGSIGFIGIVRSGLMVGAHPEMDDTYILAGQKSNLSKPPESLAYSIAATPPDYEVPRISWLGASEVTAREMNSTPDDEGERDRLAEAKEFLRDVLRAGPVGSKQIKKEASEADISWRTVERAKSALKVQSARDGEGGRWVWVLDAPGGERVSVSDADGGVGGVGGLGDAGNPANDGGDGGLPFPTTTTTTYSGYRYGKNGQDRQLRQDRQAGSDNSHADAPDEPRQDRQVVQLRQSDDPPGEEPSPRERLQRRVAERRRRRGEGRGRVGGDAVTAVLRLVEKPDGRPTTREAVEELLADNPERWWAFEEAALDGVPALRGSVLGFRGALRARGHAFETHEEQFGETFMALLAVAEEILPGSPGVARARLRERVRDDVRPRPEGGVRILGDVDVRRAVEVVLAYEDWLFDEFALAAGSGHARLYAAAHRVRDGLAKTGRRFTVEEVEDELRVLVRELMPNAPAARDAGGGDDA